MKEQCNWIVVNQEGYVAECLRCGKREPPPYLPISVDVFVKWCSACSEAHKNCKDWKEEG
jgi:hypothetical protein